MAYLNNLPEKGGETTFTMVIPDYRLQPRDILFITIKAMSPEGRIVDYLTTDNRNNVAQLGGEANGYIYGYDINPEGNILLPVLGTIKVAGLTLEEARKTIQESTDKVFKDSMVECKLLSFKFTVIGEVKMPGAFVNYNNYLTVLEAVGRAGGVGDYGNRDRVLVIRSTDKGTKTYRLNLQDKNIITSEAYFIMPNDVIVIEPLKQKIFSLNLPTLSFIVTTTLSTLTTTLLLINYLGK
jgi:polysaccharide export outer membrane protein